MTFKRLTSPSAGDSTHFGGLDVNKFSDYLGGTDIGSTETIDINTLTAFRNSKFSLRNPANTFSYVYVPSAIVANRNVTLPLLTGNDQVTMDNHPTTLTNKTIAYGSNTITGLPSSGGGGKATYKYTIWKNGSNYEAVNNDTAAVDSTSTNAQVVIQAAVNACNTAGGGSIFLRANTVYTITGGTEIVAKDNVTLVGENKDNTILDQPSTPAGAAIKGPDATTVTKFGVYNLTVRGSTNAWPLMNFDGTADCIFDNCRFIRTGTPGSSMFVVMFGDGAHATRNTRLKFTNNEVTGNTNDQDMVGGGNHYYCDFGGNWIHDNDIGQGIAATGAYGSIYHDNIFWNVDANVVGFEGPSDVGPPASPTQQCERNIIADNICISSGGIKLSQQSDGGQQHSESRHNIVNGNLIAYSTRGLEDGHGIGDIITNNVIYRCKEAGIVATIDHCTIANNHFIDNNYDNGTTSIGGTGGLRRGGIELREDALWSGTRSGNRIHDNLFWRTAVSFVVPSEYDKAGGTTKTGVQGGIYIDDSYNTNYVYDNLLDGLESGMFIRDFGTNNKLSRNQGYVTENDGTATVTSGNTSVTVNHGLAVTPALQEITITPTNNLGSSTKFWISSPTSTQFTINATPAPGASTATFAWQIITSL